MVFTTFVVAAHMAMQNAAFQYSIPGMAKAPAAESVLAKVNGVEIKAKDVEDLLWDVRGSEILDDLINYQIFRAGAEKMGVFVTDAEVESELSKYLEEMKQGLAPGQSFDDAMAQSGLTKNRLFLRAKASLYLTKLGLIDFDAKKYVRVSTIIVQPRSSAAADVASTIGVVQKAYDRIKAGEPWSKLVDELVVDPQGRQNRGLLGWRELSAFPQSVQDEFKVLPKGDISKPVQTQHGIQIFRVEAKGSDATAAEIDAMKTELRPTLMTSARAKYFKDVKVDRLYPPKKSGS